MTEMILQFKLVVCSFAYRKCLLLTQILLKIPSLPKNAMHFKKYYFEDGIINIFKH